MEHNPPESKKLFWKSGILVRSFNQPAPGQDEQYLYSVQIFKWLRCNCCIWGPEETCAGNKTLVMWSATQKAFISSLHLLRSNYGSELNQAVGIALCTVRTSNADIQQNNLKVAPGFKLKLCGDSHKQSHTETVMKARRWIRGADYQKSQRSETGH